MFILRTCYLPYLNVQCMWLRCVFIRIVVFECVCSGNSALFKESLWVMCYLLYCKVRLLWICTMDMSMLACFHCFTATYRGSPVTSWYLANEVEGMCYLLCCKARLLWICTMGMSKLVCFTSFTLACWGGHIRLLTEDPQWLHGI